MATTGNRAVLEQFWQAIITRDCDTLEKLLAADYVWEMPQSGERVRGAKSESRVTYPDGSVWHAVDIFRFRDGKILHQVAYFAPTIEAPEWRARWVKRF